MTRPERDAMRAQVASKDWECSAELLLTMLDDLDRMEAEIERRDDIIRKLARGEK